MQFKQTLTTTVTGRGPCITWVTQTAQMHSLMHWLP